jgi:hypothetical protein
VFAYFGKFSHDVLVIMQTTLLLWADDFPMRIKYDGTDEGNNIGIGVVVGGCKTKYGST